MAPKGIMILNFNCKSIVDVLLIFLAYVLIKYKLLNTLFSKWIIVTSNNHLKIDKGFAS